MLKTELTFDRLSAVVNHAVHLTCTYLYSRPIPSLAETTFSVYHVMNCELYLPLLRHCIPCELRGDVGKVVLAADIQIQVFSHSREIYINFLIGWVLSCLCGHRWICSLVSLSHWLSSIFRCSMFVQVPVVVVVKFLFLLMSVTKQIITDACMKQANKQT